MGLQCPVLTFDAPPAILERIVFTAAESLIRKSKYYVETEIC